LLIEGLESRLPLAFAIFSSDNSITLTGDASEDLVVISVSPSGYFRHDLPLEGNLVSDIDTDGSLAGEQSLLATSVTLITINGEAGNDAIDASAWVGAGIMVFAGAGDDTIRGGSGDDVFFANYPDDGDDTLFGGAGRDLFYYGSGSDAIDGGEGGDEISMYSFSQVLITNTTYTANGNPGTHQGIESFVVTGTPGDDRIDASQWTNGTLSAFGGGGTDWLHGGALNDHLHGGESNDTLLGGDGDDQLYGDDPWSGSGSDVVDGGKGNDRIQADLGADIWIGGEGFDELTASGVNHAVLSNTTYIADGARRIHQGIERFIVFGTSGNDTIDARAFTYGSIIAAGLEGDDVIRGGAGNDRLFGDDTYYYFGFRSGNDVLEGGGGNDSFSEVWGNDVIKGGVGNDELIVGENTSVEISGSFDGGPGVDTVKAIAGTNTWNVTGAGIANLNGTANLALTAIEFLVGGSGDDQFIFAAAGRLTGQVLGGDGFDTISFAAKTIPHTVNLQSNTATSTGGIGGIESFVGSNSATTVDVFVGANSVTNWLIDGENSGSLTSTPTGLVSFSGFESLTGGTAADAFTFTSAGSLSRSLTGGTGIGVIDTLDLSAKSGALDFRLNATSNTVPGAILGNYTGIEQITGNSVAGSTVTRVNNTTTAWTVNASGQVVVSRVTYIGVGAIAGGPGADTITGPAVSATWTINAVGGGTLAIPGATVGFTDVENLTGGIGSDAFDILPEGSVTGNLNGGTGAEINSLSYATWSTGVTVNLAVTTPANATAVTGLVSNIQMVTGGSGNDALTGRAALSTILIGMAGNDTLVGGSQRDMLFGGTGADSLQSGSADDLLISGTTAFDTNRAALLLLHAEWTSTRTFAQRTANIWGNGTGTRSNGSTFLNNDPSDAITDTVFADSDVDSLTGGLGQDWFFALASEVTDFLGTGTTQDRRNG
jgi:Ca2+-binding RTX toxin-like protein